MKKNLKVLSTASLAAVFATSAIVPTAAIAAENATGLTVDSVIVTQGDLNLKISDDMLSEAIFEGFLNGSEVTYVVTNEGDIYSDDLFSEALFETNGNISEAFTFLKENGYQVTDLPVVEGEFNEDGELVAKDGQEPEVPTPELAVESVKATNPTTVKVTFNQELPEDFDTSKLQIEGLKITSISFEGDTVTAKVSGAEFDKSYSVYYDGENGATVKFGKVEEYFTLKIKSDAVDSNGNTIPDIKATGDTTMQLTAYVVDNETQEKVALDGAIQFLATNGSLGQSQVVLQNGEASVQLRSVSSLETIYSDITAKVVSNNELSGLVGNMKVEFVPELAEEVEEKAVKVVKAQTERADRIEIVLDKPKAELTKEELELVAESLKVTNDVKGTPTDRKILEVRQVNDRVLEVLLDVYNENLDRTTAEYKAENHLTDNVIHSIKVTHEVKDVLLPTKEGEELEFKLTDSTQQFALGAKGLDQRTIEVRFSEPVVAAKGEAANTVGKHNAFDLSNYVLDGVQLSDPETKIDLKRDPKTGEVIGDGHIIQIDLRGKDVIREKNLILQVRNVGDWSSVTNEVNAITTQDLFLATDIDATKPVPSVMSQSPEQYMIELSQPVYVESGKKLENLIDVRYGEVLEEDDKTTNGKKGDLSKQLISSGDEANIKITALDKNGNVVKENDIHDKNAPITAILVELTKDWTEIETGKGYWQAAPQIQFKFAKNAFVTELGNKSEARSEYALNNVHDYVSPTIVKYAQRDIEEQDENGKKVILKNASGIADITFSEPVQIPGASGKGTQGSGAPNTPNASQGTDVQSPVVEFSKDGVTVKGHIFGAKPADFDFSVAPGNATESSEAYKVLKDAIDKKNEQLKEAAGDDWDEKKDALTAIGDWKLTITGVSDDYGNTMATQAFDYTVPADKEAEKDKPLGISPFVTYAEYEQIDDKDIITIKFSEVMSNTDARGVGLVANYILNSQELSKVSGAKITKGITGVTNDWDGVTIELPKGSVTAPDFMLTLPTNFISKDDQMLTGANKLNFVKEQGQVKKSAYKPGLLLTNDEGLTLTEATAKAFEDLTIEGGSTIATDFTAGTDEDKASSLKATITFSGDVGTPQGKKSPKANPESLQVTINDKVVTDKAKWAAQTLTVDLDKDALKAAELDNLTKESRIEVKVNGQTVHVGILQDQSEIDAENEEQEKEEANAAIKAAVDALDPKVEDEVVIGLITTHEDGATIAWSVEEESVLEIENQIAKVKDSANVTAETTATLTATVTKDPGEAKEVKYKVTFNEEGKIANIEVAE